MTASKDKEKPWVKVFVYGTLMTGCALHGWLSDKRFAKKLRDGTIFGYAMLSLGPYPALINVGEDFQGGVRGELWELHPGLFAELKAMEERVGYTTENVEVFPTSTTNLLGSEAKAFVFAKFDQYATVKWNVTTKNPKPKQQIIKV